MLNKRSQQKKAILSTEWNKMYVGYLLFQKQVIMKNDPNNQREFQIFHYVQNFFQSKKLFFNFNKRTYA